MGCANLVPLKCRAETLSALASGLKRFGPAEGAPDWLVSGVWLCTDQADFLATPSTEVLSTGFLARSLSIHATDELVASIDSDLPDIAVRLIGHSRQFDLSRDNRVPTAPASLQHWPDGAYSTEVLVRVATRPTHIHRVATGLLFTSANRALLVASDPSTLALVISDDAHLIERFARDCDKLSAAHYLSHCS